MNQPRHNKPHTSSAASVAPTFSSLPAMVSPTQDAWLQSLMQTPHLRFEPAIAHSPQTRLIRLDEINEDGHQAYRQALANVYATLDPEQNVRFLYLLDGSASGVALYFGVVSDIDNGSAHEAMKNLRGALEGQLQGINFGEEISAETRRQIFEQFCHSAHQGVMLGAPTGQGQDEANAENNFQGLDRLVHSLQSGSRSDRQNDAHWRIAVVSQPLPRALIREHLNTAYSLSSDLTALIRTSIQASGNTSRQKSSSVGTSDSTGINTGKCENWGTNQGSTDTKNQGKSSGSNSSSISSSENTGSSQAKTDGTSHGTSVNSGTSKTETKSENASLSDTQGNSFGLTQDLTNKRAQHLVDYLDKQLIPRLHKGFTKGLFHTAVYVTADNKSTYQRLKNTLRATFQGAETTMSPLEVHDLPEKAQGQLLQLPCIHLTHPENTKELLFHGLQTGARNTLGTLLTAEELAIVASLPQQELQGVRRRKTVDFAMYLPGVPDKDKNALDLGCIIGHGRKYENNRVLLSRADLNKHTFVTGVTGAGKTTTCLNLLLESDLPFLVIEPAKTEYRELANTGIFGKNAIDYYRPNGDDYQSLRINPFALVRQGQRIKSHAGFLKNVFSAVFPLEASMPMMLEQAILSAYMEKGWDLDENEFFGGVEGMDMLEPGTSPDPFNPIYRAWPTLTDMIRQLDLIIANYGLGKEFEEKYRGSLVSRLRSLTDGTLGRVLDVPQSINFHTLLERRAVIELEELQSGEEKALVMALLLGAINETMRAHHAQDPQFRQLTLVEEAHRLLSRPEPGDKAAALAVESFADMLSEVRKYGTGLIIADQIPAKLIPDVIKNTHCKIVHRLFAEDDRRAMGESMMMDEGQRNFLPNLGTGEAIVFCGGWHGPAHTAIRNDRAQTDNLSDNFSLTERCITQLWRERIRYYPHFSRLEWLSVEHADAKMFADFVRSTQQAQNQLIKWAKIAYSSKGQSEGAKFLAAQQERSIYAWLKNWWVRWQPVAATAQADYEQWHFKVAQIWPQNLLAAAWVALLLDANPRPNTQEQEITPLNHPDQHYFLCDAISILMRLLEEKSSVEAFNYSVKSSSTARDFKIHIENLSRFKSI